MAEIRGILEQAELTPGARELALRIFEILAEAEAKAHGWAMMRYTAFAFSFTCSGRSSPLISSPICPGVA